MHHHKTAATSSALREKLYLHLSTARSQTGRPTAADLEEMSFSMPVKHKLSRSHQYEGYLFPNLQYENYYGH